MKSNPDEILMIQNFSPVKDEGGLGHVLVDLLVIQCHKLVPLGTNHNSMGVRGCSVGTVVGGDEGGDPAWVVGTDVWLGEVLHHLGLGHLRVIDGQSGSFI